MRRKNMKTEVFDFYNSTSIKSYNLDETIRYQLKMLDGLDAYTRRHSDNVANITCRLCEKLKLSKGFTVYCTTCAYLHDIGKIFIPPSVLQKPGKLTEEEYEVMKTHTSIGYKICMNDLKLRPYAAGTLYHHESLDGSGYPHKLQEKDIPYEAQIIRVADEFDALVNKRQYKSHIGVVDTLKFLISECYPMKDSESDNIVVKDSSVGKVNPIIVKALIKVIIDDTEYEISCIMDYLKDLKKDIKRLKEIEKYDKKRLSSKDEKKQNYYLEGMKSLLVNVETIDNYNEVLASYTSIFKNKSEQIDRLFEEIKYMKKLKF